MARRPRRLERGDVVTAIDGQGVDDAGGVGFRLGVKPLGGAAAVTALRGGKTMTATVKLIAAPETPPRDAIRIKTRSPFEARWWRTFRRRVGRTVA